jgi:molybdate transport system substrate-binding protein
MRDRAIGLFFIIFGCGLAAPIRSQYQAGGLKADNSAAVELSVAAPEELNPAITEVAESFEQKTGNRVRLTFGDSASLYSQIRNGARFDAFFSTDMDHPRRLVASGTATGGSLTEYAHDNLVLWISPVMRLGIPARNPLLIVRDKSISHIAITDPKHTTSGKVAEEALRAAHAYDIEVRNKVVIEDDLSEVAHLLENGDADLAVVPRTATCAYPLYGTRVIPIAPRLYRPIRMGSVAILRSKYRREALEFLHFAGSPDGKAIFHREGF